LGETGRAVAMGAPGAAVEQGYCGRIGGHDRRVRCALHG
jgi:hypothetical protein